jgi:hypothetical protein
LRLSDPEGEGQENSLYQFDISKQYENRPQIQFEIMAPSLKKIFIQVPDLDHPGVQERFLTICKEESLKKVIRGKIEMLAGTDLFYIPDNMPG